MEIGGGHSDFTEDYRSNLELSLISRESDSQGRVKGPLKKAHWNLGGQGINEVMCVFKRSMVFIRTGSALERFNLLPILSSYLMYPFTLSSPAWRHALGKRFPAPRS